MILLPLLALALGFALIYLLPGGGYAANEAIARYTAIAVLAGLDTVLGGVRAHLKGDFDDLVFVSGFFVNALLAGGLVVLGERLGLETGFGDQRVSAMLIAAVVVFGSRIFNNLAALRRLMIERWRNRQEARQTPSTATLQNETPREHGAEVVR